MRLLILVAALLFSPLSGAVNHGDYVLTHKAGDGNQFRVESSHYGRWRGYLSTEAPEPAGRTQVVRFTFYSPDYFSEDNRGHFGVGLRASSVFPDGDVSRIEARGRGIILGNATEYPATTPGCGPTATNNVITFETWWRDDAQRNCVTGWTESQRLENGQYYRLTIKSRRDNGLYVSYVLEKFAFGFGWVAVGADSMFDFTPAASNEDGGIFLAEVFSTHAWTMHIWGLTVEDEE